MRTISVDEIQSLYKSCGLITSAQYVMRTDINTGSLYNQLNANYTFLNRTEVNVVASSSYSIEKKL